ncbi:hypothetical protein GDO81_021614 [Engystomops pustulosus]|uniref:Uncharacterized protein n=1 Tax=Engystomops pustulosus TaxID=76066 RepID=A0AAV6Z9R9_ENGPU|nr:hypothetical protein GDO81_021614 [Engystomops pustulosus]
MAPAWSNPISSGMGAADAELWAVPAPPPDHRSNVPFTLALVFLGTEQLYGGESKTSTFTTFHCGKWLIYRVLHNAIIYRKFSSRM